MSAPFDVTQRLLELEQELLRPDVRGAPEKVSALLADGFVEFGSSGTIDDKPQVIAALQQETGRGPRTIADFSARQLGPDVCLVTHRVVESRTIRSSVWRRTDGQWRMEFHQGTKMP
jgi:hypothetical protein